MIKTPSKSTRSAFTLVELLVVIGIIALLIGILLPTLGKAQAAARTTVCLSQLRQVGMALTSYIADSKGFIPPSYYYSLSNPASNTSFFDITQEYLPKTATKSIWTCPDAIDGTTNQYPLTYGANRSAHVWYWVDSPLLPGFTNKLVKVTKIRRSSEVISIADAAQSSGVFTTGGWLDWTDAFQTPDLALQANASRSLNTLPGWSRNSDTVGNNYHIRFRHNKNTRANVLFVDGHAETVDRGQLQFRNLAINY